MKVLIIITSHKFDVQWIHNIKILNDYMKTSNINVDYCGISNQDDFDNYESIIQFKYKIINVKPQFSKICDFITDYKSMLDYTWYIKFRPDIRLLDNINFDLLHENAINARARVYYGPSQIMYGMSVNGKNDEWSNIGCCYYSEKEHNIILDDMIYIFHNNVIHMNAFNKVNVGHQGEWQHTEVFVHRNINLHVIGIHLCLEKYSVYSGNINM